MVKPIIYTNLFIVLLIFISGSVLSGQSIPDSNHFAAEINQFIDWDRKNSFPEKAILFVGSSSIRLWMTHEYFPDYPVINRGFGGSQIADVNDYLEYTVLKYRPAVIVFYAGDNDIAGGKRAETVVSDFVYFITAVRQQLPVVRILYLSIKLSPSRWLFWAEMKRANEEIKKITERYDFLTYVDCASLMLDPAGKPRMELFAEDKLHLSEKGYRLWSDILLPFLKETLKKD
jgi:lysophospholipase L1-like esterase